MVAQRKPVKARVPLAVKRYKTTGAGQHAIGQSRCISTLRATGKACAGKLAEDGVPYCRECMKTGDPSLRVASHPKAGKILVAARPLPAGYRVALWGRIARRQELSAKSQEWAFTIAPPDKQLDPTPFKGSLVQFCACAGPTEVAAVKPFPASTGVYGGKKYGCWMFRTIHKLPKNWQVTMQYGNNSKESAEFFAERGILRCDVGTPAFPALRRKDAKAIARGMARRAAADEARKAKTAAGKTKAVAKKIMKKAKK